jgi:hypothetical protein
MPARPISRAARRVPPVSRPGHLPRSREALGSRPNPEPSSLQRLSRVRRVLTENAAPPAHQIAASSLAAEAFPSDVRNLSANAGASMTAASGTASSTSADAARASCGSEGSAGGLRQLAAPRATCPSPCTQHALGVRILAQHGAWCRPRQGTPAPTATRRSLPRDAAGEQVRPGLPEFRIDHWVVTAEQSRLARLREYGSELSTQVVDRRGRRTS